MTWKNSIELRRAQCTAEKDSKRDEMIWKELETAEKTRKAWEKLNRAGNDFEKSWKRLWKCWKWIKSFGKSWNDLKKAQNSTSIQGTATKFKYGDYNASKNKRIETWKLYPRSLAPENFFSELGWNINNWRRFQREISHRIRKKYLEKEASRFPKELDVAPDCPKRKNVSHFQFICKICFRIRKNAHKIPRILKEGLRLLKVPNRTSNRLKWKLKLSLPDFIADILWELLRMRN